MKRVGAKGLARKRKWKGPARPSVAAKRRALELQAPLDAGATRMPSAGQRRPKE